MISMDNLNAPPPKERFGFVTLCGEPNAGKSTLLNALTGEKVAAVSYKPQTTRFNILSIVEECNEKYNSQIAFIDTPGLFKPKTAIDKILKKHAYNAIKDADIILFLIDISKNNLLGAHQILESLLMKYENAKFIIIFNKIDKASKQDIVKKSLEFEQYERISDFFMISALNLTSVDKLKSRVFDLLGEEPWLYPTKSKKDIRRWACEITMEYIFKNLDNEIPYQTYIEPLHLQEAEDGIHIYQNIIVNKDSQKPIVLGNKGTMIKRIGEGSRLEIAKIIKRRTHLHLFVKVVKNWMNKEGALKDAGLVS